jgi:hypothetical protein
VKRLLRLQWGESELGGFGYSARAIGWIIRGIKKYKRLYYRYILKQYAI